MQHVRQAAAAAFMAAVAFSVPAQAQRMSLAERVSALEQQVQSHGGSQGSVDLVNQINALQSQVQNLQGQVEELRHQLDEMKNRSKEQYIDLDSRIGRLEGRNPAGAAGAAPPPQTENGNLPDVALGTTQPAQQPSQPPPQQQELASNMPADNGAPPPASAEDAKSAYDQAFAALKDGRYAESARRFQQFIQQYPNNELTPNAYYWLGESYYVTQNYPVSLDTFRRLLTQYPDSQKAQDALLKIGYCQYEMKQWDQAEATLNQVVQKYPNTTAASLAQGRLRALKLEARRQ